MVLIPTVQSVDSIDICEAECLVETCHISLVDASDGVFSGLHVLIADKVGINLIVGFQLHLVGNHLGNQQLILAGGADVREVL